MKRDGQDASCNPLDQEQGTDLFSDFFQNTCIFEKRLQSLSCNRPYQSPD